MSRPGDKDWLPHAEHLKRLPKKRMASAVLFFNTQGEILMVKPIYKDFWILPGGVIEHYESPDTAAAREVTEELGITTDRLQFIAVIHTPRKKIQDDAMHFYFHGGELSDHTIAQIKLQREELSGYKFLTADEVPKFSKASFVPFLSKLLVAIKDKRPVLINNEEGNTQ